jgi:type I restriction enzyme R subunit
VLCKLLHGIDWRPTESETAGQKATKLKQSVAAAAERLTETEEATREYLDTYVAFARWNSNASTHPAAIGMAGDAGFFSIVAKQLRQLEAKSAEASPAAQQAVKQFFSTGLAAGEISDVFDLLGEERPQISVLSDEFLDGLANGEQPNLRLALVRKLIDDQLRARIKTNNLQAREFEDEVQRLLASYRNRQLSTADVIQALIEIAKRIRDATQRHEEIGLSEEEAAFYDALAGTADASELDDQLKSIAVSLVKSIRQDLAIDWTDRRATEDAIRSKIKRILRRSGYTPPAPADDGPKAWGGGDPLDYAVERVITQAKTMYRYWPEVSIEEGVLSHSPEWA